MAQGKTLGKLPPLARKIDAAEAVHAHMTIAGHALQGCRDCGRGYVEFFGEACADGRLVLFEHLPDGFEVIFLLNAGLIPPQNNLLNSVPLRRECYGWMLPFSAANCFRMRPANSATRCWTFS